MNIFKKEIVFNPPIPNRRNKEKDFIKKNLQLMRRREIDALVEKTRQDIVDRYIDLEN